MSKPIKELIVADYQKRFDALDGALVVDIRGMTSNETNTMRAELRSKQIRVTIIKNALARKAFTGTSLEALESALVGPSALAYGAESVVDVAREIVAWARKVQKLTLKGAVLDGQFFDGKEGVKRLSQFPTREEAQARVVQLALSPAKNLVGAVVGPGSKILGIVKEIQKRLEDGKTIAQIN
jgi:large subunit ribosomal protein L10